jgi:hypothetical protein
MFVWITEKHVLIMLLRILTSYSIFSWNGDISRFFIYYTYSTIPINIILTVLCILVEDFNVRHQFLNDGLFLLT